MRASRLSVASTVVLCLCAVVVTALLVRRELFPQRRDATSTTKQADWESFMLGGSVVGDLDAPVTFVVFSDYQCPYCRKLDLAFEQVAAERPGRFKVVFRHWPLTRMHSHAYPAAVAAVCAEREGTFATFHRLLFQAQDSLSRVEWAKLALASGITDTAAFLSCMEEPESKARVEADVRAAAALGARGTPVILVDGKRHLGALPADAIMAIVDASGSR